MATVIGKTTVGVALTITPGASAGTTEEMLRELLQALPDHDWTYGTGTYQLNKWSEGLITGTSVLSGAAATLDLNLLTGMAGEAVNFSTVRLLWIYNTSTTDGEKFTVAGDFITSRIAASGHIVYPDSCLYVASPITGLTVTETTADTITVTNNGTASNTFKYFIGGQ